MKTAIAPLFALVFALGLRPVEPWRGEHSDWAPSAEGEKLQRSSLTWAIVDEWLDLTSPPIYAVTVTAYSSHEGQCDSTPHLTASGARVRRGVIALSRDLLRHFNPTAPFNWGDRVHVEGLGEFIVEDTMSGRYERRADIWLPDSASAMAWGVRELKLSPVPDNPLGL